LPFLDYNNIVDGDQIIEIVKKRLHTKAEARNQTKDQLKKFPQYHVGQQVLVKEHRLSSAEDHEIHKYFLLYKGPYTITETFNNNTVIIEDPQKQIIRCNIKNLKPYHALADMSINPGDDQMCFPPDPGITRDQSTSNSK